MSLARRTIVDQTEIRRDGVVQARLAKQVVDGEQVLRSEYHRLALEPGAELGPYIQLVNAHLVEMGEAAVEPSEWDRIRRVVTLEHTPEVVATYQARRRVEQKDETHGLG